MLGAIRGHGSRDQTADDRRNRRFGVRIAHGSGAPYLPSWNVPGTGRGPRRSGRGMGGRTVRRPVRVRGSVLPSAVLQELRDQRIADARMHARYGVGCRIRRRPAVMRVPVVLRPRKDCFDGGLRIDTGHRRRVGMGAYRCGFARAAHGIGLRIRLGRRSGSIMVVPERGRP